MALSDWTQIHSHILQLEQEGLVTRTFRRLDPERHQAIIMAILEEAIEKGPTSLNIKQVAERADVSVGSLYTYFVNRDGLLTFAIELCTRFINDSFNSYRPLLLAMPLPQALAAYLTGGVEWGRMQEGLIQFFARAAYHGEADLADRVVRPIATNLREMVHAMLAQALERGEIREDVDFDAVVRLIHALTLAIGDAQLLPYLNSYFQVEDDDMPPERILDALIALILRGIGTQDP